VAPYRERYRTLGWDRARSRRFEALAAEYEAKIYAAAKPVPRKYEIVRVVE
jgi:hypothetical protein